MKKYSYSALVLALAVSLLVPARSFGISPTDNQIRSSQKTPGVELAQTISLITGVAISPLMGTGAVGAWKYFQAKSAQERSQLPWFARPWFWLPALLIVTACFLKDTVGIAVPKLLKKPFDAAEVIEHKVSGLIAAGAFVPLIIPLMENSSSRANEMAANGFLASVDPTLLGNFIFIPAMMLVFLVVCLASGAINILILLSPFRIVDIALKSFRLAVLSLVAVTAMANPWIGGIVALMVVIVAFFVAGWSLRLSHFGLVFVWDLLTGSSRKFVPAQTANGVFLSRPVNKVPARTYGLLVRDEQGGLVLKYRPWLVLPRRTLELPAGSYVVARGLLYSEIARVEGAGVKSLVLLPPRYRSHEEELVAIYRLAGVRDAGLRAAFNWLRDSAGFRTRQPDMGLSPA